MVVLCIGCRRRRSAVSQVFGALLVEGSLGTGLIRHRELQLEVNLQDRAAVALDVLVIHHTVFCQRVALASLTVTGLRLLIFNSQAGGGIGRTFTLIRGIRISGILAVHLLVVVLHRVGGVAVGRPLGHIGHVVRHGLSNCRAPTVESVAGLMLRIRVPSKVGSLSTVIQAAVGIHREGSVIAAFILHRELQLEVNLQYRAAVALDGLVIHHTVFCQRVGLASLTVTGLRLLIFNSQAGGGIGRTFTLSRGIRLSGIAAVHLLVVVLHRVLGVGVSRPLRSVRHVVRHRVGPLGTPTGEGVAGLVHIGRIGIGCLRRRIALEQARRGTVLSIPGTVIAGRIDNRIIIHAMNGDGHASRSLVSILIGIGEGEGFRQRITGIQFPNRFLCFVENIPVGTIPILGHGAVLSRLIAPGKGIGTVTLYAILECVALRGSRLAVFRDIMLEAVDPRCLVVQGNISDGRLTLIPHRLICSLQIHILRRAGITVAVEAQQFRMVIGDNLGLDIRRGQSRAVIEILDGELVGILVHAGHLVLAQNPALDRIHQSPEPIGVLVVASFQLAAFAALEHHGVLDGTGRHLHRVVRTDVGKGIAVLIQKVLVFFSVHLDPHDLVSFVNGPGHSLVVALVHRFTGRRNGAAGLVVSILRNDESFHGVGLLGVVNRQHVVALIAVLVGIIFTRGIAVVDVIAFHAALAQGLINLILHIGSSGVFPQSHRLSIMDLFPSFLQDVLDGQVSRKQIPQPGMEHQVLRRHGIRQGFHPANKDLVGRNIVLRGRITISTGQVRTIVHFGILLNRILAHQVGDGVLIDCVVTRHHHVVIRHGFRQTVPPVEGVTGLGHDIRNQAQLGAVCHILNHLILGIREIVTHDLIGDGVLVDGSRAFNDHVVIRHGSGQVLVPSAEGVALRRGVGMAVLCLRQLGTIRHILKGLDLNTIYLVNDVMLVDGAGGGQDDIMLRHGEAAAGNGHVRRGPVRHRVTGLFRLGRNSNRAAGILAALKLTGVIRFAVQQILNFIRGLLPLSRQGIVCVAAIRIHLDLVTGLHERLSIRQQPAQEGIVGASGLFRDYRVHAIDHKAGIGKGCFSLDGTAVGVINHLGGTLGIAPLRRQGYAAFGNGNGVAGVIDLAVCAGLPAQEELVNRSCGGLCLNLSLCARCIHERIAHSTAAVGVITHSISFTADPVGHQGGVAGNGGREVERCAVLRPPGKEVSLAGRLLRFCHGRTVRNIVNLRFVTGSIVIVEGHGIGLRRPAGIEDQIVCRHGLTAEAVRITRQRLVVIPTCKVPGLTIDVLCGLAHLIAGRCPVGNIRFIGDIRYRADTGTTVGVEVNVVGIAGIVDIIRVISFRLTVMSKARNLNIIFFRKTPTRSIHIERLMDLVVSSFFIVINDAAASSLLAIYRKIIIRHCGFRSIEGRTILARIPEIVRILVAGFLPPSIGLGAVFDAFLAVYGLPAAAVPPTGLVHLEGQRIPLALIVHIPNSHAVTGNSRGSLLGLRSIQGKAGIVLAVVGSFFPYRTGLYLHFCVGIAVIIGVFLPVHHFVLCLRSRPLGVQVNVLRQLAAERKGFGQLLILIPTIKPITGPLRLFRLHRHTTGDNIHGFHHGAAIGVEGNPVGIFHHRIQSHIRAVDPEIFIRCAVIFHGPAHQGLIHAYAEQHLVSTYRLAIHIFLGGNDLALPIQIEYIVCCLKAGVQIDVSADCLNLAEVLKLLAVLSVPTGKSLAFRCSRHGGLEQGIAHLHDLLIVLFVIHIIGIRRRSGGSFGIHHIDGELLGLHGDLTALASFHRHGLAHGLCHGFTVAVVNVIHLQGSRLAVQQVGAALDAEGHIHHVAVLRIDFLAGSGVSKGDVEGCQGRVLLHILNRRPQHIAHCLQRTHIVFGLRGLPGIAQQLGNETFHPFSEGHLILHGGDGQFRALGECIHRSRHIHGNAIGGRVARNGVLLPNLHGPALFVSNIFHHNVRLCVSLRRIFRQGVIMSQGHGHGRHSTAVARALRIRRGAGIRRAVGLRRSAGVGRTLRPSGSAGVGRTLRPSGSAGVGRTLRPSGNAGIGRILRLSGSLRLRRGLGLLGSLRLYRGLGIDRSLRLYRGLGIDRSLGVYRGLRLYRSLGIDRSLGVYRGLGINRSLGIDRGLGIDRSLGIDRGLGIDRSLGIDRGLGIDRSLGVYRSLGIDRSLGVHRKTRINRALRIHGSCRLLGDLRSLRLHGGLDLFIISMRYNGLAHGQAGDNSVFVHGNDSFIFHGPFMFAVIAVLNVGEPFALSDAQLHGRVAACEYAGRQ